MIVYLLVRDAVSRVFTSAVTFWREDSIRAGMHGPIDLLLAGLYQVRLTALLTPVLATTHQAFPSPVIPGSARETFIATFTIIILVLSYPN